MTVATFDDFITEPTPQTQDPATTGDGLAGVLKRKDDRLLDDVGLSRADIMTAHEIFLKETRAQRALWSL